MAKGPGEHTSFLRYCREVSQRNKLAIYTNVTLRLAAAVTRESYRTLIRSLNHSKRCRRYYCIGTDGSPLRGTLRCHSPLPPGQNMAIVGFPCSRSISMLSIRARRRFSVLERGNPVSIGLAGFLEGRLWHVPRLLSFVVVGLAGTCGTCRC
jgi:hypothetical protein